jgi:hypothetical protein
MGIPAVLDGSLVVLPDEPQKLIDSRAHLAQCQAECEVLGRLASNLLFKEWEKESSTP